MISSKQMAVLNKHSISVFAVRKLFDGVLIETPGGSLFVLTDELTYVGQLES